MSAYSDIMSPEFAGFIGGIIFTWVSMFFSSSEARENYKSRVLEEEKSQRRLDRDKLRQEKEKLELERQKLFSDPEAWQTRALIAEKQLAEYKRMMPFPREFQKLDEMKKAQDMLWIRVQQLEGINTPLKTILEKLPK